MIDLLMTDWVRIFSCLLGLLIVDSVTRLWRCVYSYVRVCMCECVNILNEMKH